MGPKPGPEVHTLSRILGGFWVSTRNIQTPEGHDVQARQAQKDDVERVQRTLFVVRKIPQPTHVPARNN